MKNLNDMSNWKDKQLRTLRNNINNRLESFKNNGGASALQASNILYGKTEKECADLLAKVKSLMSSRKKENN